MGDRELPGVRAEQDVDPVDLDDLERGPADGLEHVELVLPGHGPWTTVEQERSSNPFLT